MKARFHAVFQAWKQAASKLKAETYALFLAYQHPQTPWYAKVFAGVVIAYAFSPIDLVPDFIPVLGYLDDLVLVPLGIRLAVKMIPAEVMQACRAQAQREMMDKKPTSWLTAAIIVLIWVGLAALCFLWLRRFFV